MRRWSLFISAGLVFFALIATLAGRALLHAGRLNVLLVSVESLRDDMVQPELTPALLAAAGEGFRFPRHRAQSAWTGSNIVAILSGLSPFQSGLHSRGQTVAAELLLPLEQLQQRAYRVEGLQAFMAMDIYSHLGIEVAAGAGDPRGWLVERRQQREHFFLWYHYLHTHLPYSGDGVDRQAADPAADSDQARRLRLVRQQAAVLASEAVYSSEDRPHIRAAQGEAVRRFDRWFADLYDTYQRSGLAENTILVLTADHGDEHGERGMVGHASTTLAGHLHEEIVRVPLFVWLPPALRQQLGNPDFERITSHFDIMPTLCRFLGLEPTADLSGRDLWQKGASDWYAMTSSGGFAEPQPEAVRYYEYAYSDGRWKSRWRQHADGGEQFFLYDLHADPGELQEVAVHQPELAARHRQLLQPLIVSRVVRPVLAAGDDGLADELGGPRWLLPQMSGRYRYQDLQGRFRLQWSGEQERRYLLDYQAGEGARMIRGQLEVNGPGKDFGEIDQEYWNTWIVPLRHFRLRVRELEARAWSDWLELEALP